MGVDFAGEAASSFVILISSFPSGGPPVARHHQQAEHFDRAVEVVTVVGAGLDSVLWNGLSATGLPSLLALTAPFPYQLDTTRWPDGPYRLEAVGRPDPSTESYL